MEFISWLKCSLTTWPWRTPALKSFGFPSGGTFFWNLIMELRTLNYLKDLFSSLISTSPVWSTRLQTSSIYLFKVQYSAENGEKWKNPHVSVFTRTWYSEFLLPSWARVTSGQSFTSSPGVPMLNCPPGVLNLEEIYQTLLAERSKLVHRVKMCWSCLLVGKIF